jgi:c-di-GMP-binding flagellar brake protein YcgR
LPKFNLLFQTKLTRENEKHFYFEFPSTAYKVQRRDHFRLTIPSDFSFWIEFESPTLSFEKFKRKAIDMSAGGMSFRSEASDTTQLKIGITLKNLQFTLRDRLILTDAKIKYHKPIQNPYRFEKTEDQYKIGLQFITLPAEKRELIASYVFEQNRKLYARYLS